jgi:hypothetical protein
MSDQAPETPNDLAEEVRILRKMHARMAVDYEKAVSDRVSVSESNACLRAQLARIAENHEDLHTELVSLLDSLHAREYPIGDKHFIKLVEEAVGYQSILDHRRCTR